MKWTIGEEVVVLYGGKVKLPFKVVAVHDDSVEVKPDLDSPLYITLSPFMQAMGADVTIIRYFFDPQTGEEAPEKDNYRVTATPMKLLKKPL